MAKPEEGQIEALKKPRCEILINESHVSSLLKRTAGSLSLAMGSFNAGTCRGPNILTERGFTLIRQETLLLRHILFTRNTTQPFPKNAGRPSQTPGFVKRPPPPPSFPHFRFLLSKNEEEFEREGERDRGRKIKNDERVKQLTGRGVFIYFAEIMKVCISKIGQAAEGGEGRVGGAFQCSA